jgi:hypothetical protein
MFQGTVASQRTRQTNHPILVASTSLRGSSPVRKDPGAEMEFDEEEGDILRVIQEIVYSL